MTDREPDLRPRQIPTSWSVRSNELFARAQPAIRSLCRCITDGPDSPEYMNHLVAAAMQLERISCLGARNSDGPFRKFDEQFYKRFIFKAQAVTPGEVYDRLAEQGVTTDAAECIRIHKIIWKIAALVCPMMACTSEQAFISEYAYAID